VVTLVDGAATIFAAIDHCTAEYVGIHAAHIQPGLADRATRLSIAGAGASGVCAPARGVITINALSNSRAAVQSAPERRERPPDMPGEDPFGAVCVICVICVICGCYCLRNPHQSA
jgi:hypothetical protein